MTQANLFDKEKALAHRDRGMQAAAQKRNPILEKARSLALKLANRDPQRRCSADEVVGALLDVGYTPKELGNAAGSVFLTKDWILVGRKKSTRVSNHGREIKVWRLK